VGKGVIGPADDTFLLAQLLGSGTTGSGLLHGFLIINEGFRGVRGGGYIETRPLFIFDCLKQIDNPGAVFMFGGGIKQMLTKLAVLANCGEYVAQI
jgi:cystathionine beta-lyase family protein involved in aluminum resistance